MSTRITLAMSIPIINTQNVSSDKRKFKVVDCKARIFSPLLCDTLDYPTLPPSLYSNKQTKKNKKKERREMEVYICVLDYMGFGSVYIDTM